MQTRYLAVVGSKDRACPRLIQHVLAKTAHLPDFSILFEQVNLLVIAQAGCRHVRLADDAGIILGSIFSVENTLVRAMDGASRRAILASDGARLIESFWGGYVAILPDENRRDVHIVRSPFGELPCYHVRYDGAEIFASDVDMLMTFGLFAPEIDWIALARHLLTNDLRQPCTCLTGLREVAGGNRISVRAGICTIDQLWSPWRFTSRERAIGSSADAASRVRETVLDCVGARASEFDHVLLGLSGGLDSSIVAASLARTGHRFSCLTLVTHDPSGDERDYAGIVADAYGSPLYEATRDVTRVDIGRSGAAHLPRPVARSFAQESERITIETAARIGADAAFDGGGGDNVFCFLQSVAPVADRLLSEGLSIGAWRTAEDICLLSQTSLWTVGRRAVRRAWFRRPAYRWPINTAYLARAASELAGDAAKHPWLQATPGAFPGKAAHIALLMAVQNYMEGFGQGAALPTLSPLMSQPLIELCLRIPSWMWCSGGQNRIVARRAFAADLPPEIAFRRSKGSPDCFVAEILEANRGRISAMLAGGELAAHGLLDVPELTRALTDPRPVHGHLFTRIMRLVDAEAWARSWSGRTIDLPMRRRSEGF